MNTANEYPFEVGDKITGLKGNMYGITNEDMLEGIVMTINGATMRVLVTEHIHRDNFGDVYIVSNSETQFKLVLPYDNINTFIEKVYELKNGLHVINVDPPTQAKILDNFNRALILLENCKEDIYHE